MKSRKSLISGLVAISILALWHFLGITLYFYWVYWWYDVVAHFLGGLAGGLATYWALFDSGLIKNRSILFSTLTVFLCVMVAGVLWEMFEAVYHLADNQEGYLLDTTNDLILDGAGALTALLLIFNKKNG